MVQKRSVPTETAKQLRELAKAIEDAQEAYRVVVANALKAGASVRGVNRVTGLATNTITMWGRERGWPTKAQKAAEADRKAMRDRWNAFIDGEPQR